MSSSAISRVHTLSLFRNLLRNAQKFVNYNFREHAKRRVAYEFHKNKNLEGADAVSAYKRGIEQLQVVKRQAIINSLYPEPPSVILSRKSCA